MSDSSATISGTQLGLETVSDELCGFLSGIYGQICHMAPLIFQISRDSEVTVQMASQDMKCKRATVYALSLKDKPLGSKMESVTQTCPHHELACSCSDK